LRTQSCTHTHAIIAKQAKRKRDSLKHTSYTSPVHGRSGVHALARLSAAACCRCSASQPRVLPRLKMRRRAAPRPAPTAVVDGIQTRSLLDTNTCGWQGGDTHESASASTSSALPGSTNLRFSSSDDSCPSLAALHDADPRQRPGARAAAGKTSNAAGKTSNAGVSCTQTGATYTCSGQAVQKVLSCRASWPCAQDRRSSAHAADVHNA
jgi:hypothetical protein